MPKKFSKGLEICEATRIQNNVSYHPLEVRKSELLVMRKEMLKHISRVIVPVSDTTLIVDGKRFHWTNKGMQYEGLVGGAELSEVAGVDEYSNKFVSL